MWAISDLFVTSLSKKFITKRHANWAISSGSHRRQPSLPSPPPPDPHPCRAASSPQSSRHCEAAPLHAAPCRHSTRRPLLALRCPVPVHRTGARPGGAAAITRDGVTTSTKERLKESVPRRLCTQPFRSKKPPAMTQQF
jgi:hypothetical protein